MIEYDPHQWRDHLFDVKGSMVRQIMPRVLLCVAWSAVVVYVNVFHFELKMSDKAHLLIGVPLGLLLVFRTNASYDRFWEGRKQWGSMTNECRNLGRAASTYLAADPALLRLLFGWLTAFPYATMHHLRAVSGTWPSANWLPPEELERTRKADHVPLAITRRITEQLQEARKRGVITDIVQMGLDQDVQLLIDYMGACERIHKTPLPFTYMVHLRRALILYCASLPLALFDTFGWLTIIVTLVIGYILLGIEEIGVEIEDPFGTDENDLPIERFCTNIENNLLSILDDVCHRSSPATPAETASSGDV